MTRLSRTVGAAAAVVLLPLVATAAHAEVRSVSDPANDGSRDASGTGARVYGDIGAVKVNHAPRKVYVTVTLAKHGQAADYYDIFVDTKKAEDGPEFVVSYSAEVGGADVRRVSGFTIGGTRSCELPHGVTRTAHGLQVAVPRPCLAIDGDAPGIVRVSVHTSMEYGGADWAPRFHAFTPWVHHQL